MTTKEKLGYDPVNHPKHYNIGSKEVLQVIEEWGADRDHMVGNAIKYIARAYWKGSFVDDLKKSVFYLNRRISNEPKGFWNRVKNWISPKYPVFNVDPAEVEFVIDDWQLRGDFYLAMALKCIAENDLLFAVHYLENRIEAIDTLPEILFEHPDFYVEEDDIDTEVFETTYGKLML